MECWSFFLCFMSQTDNLDILINSRVFSPLVPVKSMEVPAPKVTFLFTTSTLPWPSCWSLLCRGVLSGNPVPLTPARLFMLITRAASSPLTLLFCYCDHPVSSCPLFCCCYVCGKMAPERWTTSAPPRAPALLCCPSCSAFTAYTAARRNLFLRTMLR